MRVQLKEVSGKKLIALKKALAEAGVARFEVLELLYAESLVETLNDPEAYWEGVTKEDVFSTEMDKSYEESCANKIDLALNHIKDF